MNHVTSWMIKRASFDTTPFNRSKTKTVKMTKDEVMNEKKKRGGEMSNENQETIEDIVSEMRKRAQEVYEGQSGYPENWEDQMNDDEIREIADRIEAAYKRLAIPTPEQWTEIARQGAEIADLKRENDALKREREDGAESGDECGRDLSARRGGRTQSARRMNSRRT